MVAHIKWKYFISGNILRLILPDMNVGIIENRFYYQNNTKSPAIEIKQPETLIQCCTLKHIFKLVSSKIKEWT